MTERLSDDLVTFIDHRVKEDGPPLMVRLVKAIEDHEKMTAPTNAPADHTPADYEKLAVRIIEAID